MVAVQEELKILSSVRRMGRGRREGGREDMKGRRSCVKMVDMGLNLPRIAEFREAHTGSRCNGSSK